MTICQIQPKKKIKNEIERDKKLKCLVERWVKTDASVIKLFMDVIYVLSLKGE
jgi:hypothetical protein